MADLTREQFQALRDKGLSVEQIKKFSARQDVTPETSKKEVTKLWDTSGFTSGFKGFGKGLGKLALGVGTIGRSIQEGVGRLAGQDLKEESVFDIGSEQRAQAEQTLAPKGTGEKVSSFVTEVGATALPSGAAYKTTKGLGFLTRMLGRGGAGATVGTVQGGGDVDRDTAIGAAAETIIPGAAKIATGYGGSLMKGLAGLVTGKGSDVVEQVLKSPKAALKGGSKEGIEGMKEISTSVREGVRTLRKKAGKEYESLVAKAGTQKINREFVTENLSKRLASLSDASIGKSGIKFKNTPFIDAEEAQFKKVYNVINDWEDFTPTGLNKLATKISRFRRGSEESVNFDRVIDGTRRELREFVGKVDPKLKEANKVWADKMDMIDELDNVLKTSSKFGDSEGVRKTAESIGRIFNANKDFAREAVESLEKEIGVDALGQEAGRQLASGVSRSRGAIGDSLLGVTQAVIPPKLILRLTAVTGMAKNAIESRLSTLDPAARATTIEVLTDLLGEGEGTAQ